jgi:hypothetical protein
MVIQFFLRESSDNKIDDKKNMVNPVKVIFLIFFLVICVIIFGPYILLSFIAVLMQGSNSP